MQVPRSFELKAETFPLCELVAFHTMWRKDDFCGNAEDLAVLDLCDVNSRILLRVKEINR
jgi:hypothetical protein